MINKFMARQPILDMHQRLYGYEMLFRDSEKNYYPEGMDSDAATKQMICSIQTDFNLKALTGGKRAFLNLTREMCMSDIVLLLNPDLFVVEILEDATIDKAFLDQIDYLKRKYHYVFAIDDYTGQPKFDALIPYVDIVKVDFVLCNDEKRKKIARGPARKKKLLAEKVETEHDFDLAKRCGYQLVQGYYFKKPIVIKTESIAISTVTHMRLWQEINKPVPKFDEMAAIILKDAGMTLRLLNKSNTLQFFRGSKIASVQQALVRMGIEESKRWILLILLQECLQSQNDEYIRLALGRAKFLETMYIEIDKQEQANDAYIAGMFSVFSKEDAKLADILEKLMLSEEIQTAILSGGDTMGEILSALREYEDGVWDGVNTLCEKYGLTQRRLAQLYSEAMYYADDAFNYTI